MIISFLHFQNIYIYIGIIQYLDEINNLNTILHGKE
jgi:hypothetical protein